MRLWVVRRGLRIWGSEVKRAHVSDLIEPEKREEERKDLLARNRIFCCEGRKALLVAHACCTSDLKTPAVSLLDCA